MQPQPLAVNNPAPELSRRLAVRAPRFRRWPGHAMIDARPPSAADEPMLALTTCCLLFAPAAQEPTPRPLAARLRAATVLRELVGYRGAAAVAPDGAAIAVVHDGDKTARIVDAGTGDLREAPLAGETCSIALSSNGRGCWLGLEDGSIAHAPTDAEPRRFAVADAPIDGLSCVAGHVAWSSSKAGRGGVLDARDGSPRFSTAVPFGGYREPRMFLSRDGRHALHLARDPAQGGRRVVNVLDGHTGELLATAASYLAKREDELAFAPGSLFTAARVASSRWELRRLDLVSLQTTVLDRDLRGRHFVDLLASPSGRWLLEGDFEERGAVVYEVGLAAPVTGRLLGAKGVMPVGFLVVAGEEYALTTAGPTRVGLTVWSTAGEVIAADLPWAAGLRIERAGGLRGGRGLWVTSWKAREDRSIESALHVVSLPE